MKHAITHVLEGLNQGQPVAIATIVADQGSSPRSAGARMIFYIKERPWGSVGGGILEARVMVEARSLLQGKRGPGLLAYDLTPGDLDTMAMTCGGRVEILLDRVCPTEEEREMFSLWLDTLNGRKNGFFLTVLSGNNADSQTVHRAVLSSDGLLQGALPLSTAALACIRENNPGLIIQRMMRIENYLVLVEPAVHPVTLHIFGAGHVAVPTADLATKVGFEVKVWDDREEFASPVRFPGTIETRVIPDFDAVFSGIAFDRNDFIVIVTRGHLHDKIVLAHALHTRAAYIGMIGSRKKRDAIHAALFTEGFTQEALDRVHCPIGLAIGAETPEEIAVSIVAELIQSRKKQSYDAL